MPARSRRVAVVSIVALFLISCGVGVALNGQIRTGLPPAAVPKKSAEPGSGPGAAPAVNPATGTGESPVAARKTTMVVLDSSQVPQGGLLSVQVTGISGEGDVFVKAFGRKVRAFRAGDSARAFIPCGVGETPGVHTVDAESGDAVVIPAFCEVLATEFPSSRITVSSETESMAGDSKRIQQDTEKVRRAKSSTNPVAYWSQAFVLPSEARVTTPFGFIRYVNGKEWGRHWGIDYGAGAGEPVKASNAGRVVLAEGLLLSGNTVIIDHGMGLYTTYMHMRSISVKVGDIVDRGDVIGEVGSTGFSTGPHLHWSASSGEESFDPAALLLLKP